MFLPLLALLLCTAGLVLGASQEKGSLFNWDNLWQSKSYYDVLEVNEKATVKEIKKAYRRMAVKMHPDKLDIKNDEDKVNAENNFVRLARAYEILSDDKVTRRRYDCLLQEGIAEYPDDLHYNWDWVDQKLGLKSMHFHDEDAFWARGGSGRGKKSAYEDAKKFYEAEKKWSWETDTTLQDLKENPWVLLLLLGATALYFVPRETRDKITKRTSVAAEKKKRMETIQRTVEKNGILNTSKTSSDIKEASHRNRKEFREKQKRDEEEAEREVEADEQQKVELARNDLTVLLQAHKEDIILRTLNNSPAIDWRSIGNECDISNGDIFYACEQIKDMDILNKYADCLVNAFPDNDDEEENSCTEKDNDELTVNRTRQDLQLILEHLILLLDQRHLHKQKMAVAHMKNKVKSCGEKVLLTREWDAATISCLAKGVNKYQSHRKRWELVTDYMNHILSPVEPFTKPECIQQAQNIQNIQKKQHQQQQNSQNVVTYTPTASKVDARTPVSCTSASLSDSNPSPEKAVNTAPSTQSLATKSAESAIWSVEQQKQLEMGLQSFAKLQGSAKWKAIANNVEGKTVSECVERFKYLRNELQKKKAVLS